MQFMRSCFNPTIYKKNWERFWFFPLLYAIMFLFAIPVLMELNRVTGGSLDNSFITGSVSFLMNPIMAMITGLVAAMGVCSYLYTTKSVYMIHAFPVTKLQLYITSVVSGISMMAAPIILVAVVTRLYLMVHGYPYGYIVWQVMLISLAVHIIFFAIAMICALLCGMNISVPFIYILINFLVSMISLLFEGMTHVILFGAGFGLPNNIRQALTPIEKLLFSLDIRTTVPETIPMSAPRILGVKVVVIYTVIALVALVLSYFIYHFRRNESAGSVFAFKRVGIVLGQWISSFILGNGFALLFFSLGREFSGQTQYNGMSAGDIFVYTIMAILFGFLASMLSAMLVNRSLHVWKKPNTTRMILIPSAIALFAIIIWFDPMGIEKKLPDASQVRSAKAYVSNNGGDVIYTEDPDHIQDVIDVHRMAIEERLTSVPSSDSSNFSLTYTMKNGTVMRRYYEFIDTEETSKKEDSITGLLSKISNYPECVKSYHFGNEYDSNVITSICLVRPEYSTTDEAAYSEDTGLSKDGCREVYEAILSDIDAGNIITVNKTEEYEESYPSYLEVYYRYEGTKPDHPDEYDSCASVYLTSKSTHTIDALIKYGVIKSEDDLEGPSKK